MWVGAIAGQIASMIGNMIGSQVGGRYAQTGVNRGQNALESYFAYLEDLYGKSRRRLFKDYKFGLGEQTPYSQFGVDTLREYLPKLAENLKPGGSLYNWQKSEGERAIDRTLSTSGLYDSSYRTEANRRLINELSAQENERIYNRISDLFKYGTGIGSNAATIKSSLYQNRGQNVASLNSMLGSELKDLVMAIAQYEAQKGSLKGAMWQSTFAAGSSGAGNIFSSMGK